MDGMPLRHDWRVGLTVTPKLKTHYLFGELGVILRIVPESPCIKEQAEIELFGGDGLVLEPVDEWMTA